MSLTSYNKDPQATKDYRIDWSNWLQADETLSASAWACDTAGLTLTSPAYSASIATVWATGGVVGGSYKLTNTITTSLGRTDDRSITLFVRNAGDGEARALDDLIGRVARRAGYFVAGSASAGSATSLTDSARIYQPDNTLRGHYLYLVAGANKGMERFITANAQAGNSVMVAPAFPAAIVAGDAYRISALANADAQMAIEGAIAAAGKSWVRVVEDDTIALNAAQFEYALPSDVFMLQSAWVKDVVGDVWQPYTTYELIGAPGNLRILLRTPLTPDVSTPSPAQTMGKLRIVYLALPRLLQSGPETLGIGDGFERDAVTFIEEYALHLIHEMLAARAITGEATRGHLTMAATHLQKALSVQERHRKAPVSAKHSQTRAVPRHI